MSRAHDTETETMGVSELLRGCVADDDVFTRLGGKSPGKWIEIASRDEAKMHKIFLAHIL